MILHAGGVTPEGVTGSNSLEALEHSYENGFRLLELDFSWTCDGELVCVHDWNAFYGRILDTDSPTLAQFEAVRDSTYGFTSLTLDHLIAWLREHPGVSIVTDIKEDCAAGAALIAQRCPDLRSRFIIQIYHPEEYDQVADLGFEHIILTVYQMSWSEKQDTAALVRFAAEHPLEGITFPAELADTPGYVEALLEAQVPLFVHTVNDPADQAALVRQGISGIYTDLGPAPPGIRRPWLNFAIPTPSAWRNKENCHGGPGAGGKRLRSRHPADGSSAHRGSGCCWCWAPSLPEI